mgnify:CR=1 FL=1
MDGRRSVTPKHAEKTLRTLRALELRAAGLTYRQIAVELGYSTPTLAYRAVQRAVQRLQREYTEQMLALELERLDALQRAVWDKAMSGDVGAVRAAVSIIGLRAKLVGLGQETVKVGIDENDPLGQVLAEIAREAQAAAMADAGLPAARGPDGDSAQ